MIKINTLPRFYLITPDFSWNADEYLRDLELSLRSGIKLIQLRSKNLSKEEYLKLARLVLPLAHSYGAKVLLNSSERILSEVNADGIHLPSIEYSNLRKRPVSHRYLFSVACHNREQIEHAESIGADFAVLCPVFLTPSSPKGAPMGWDNFSKILKDVKLPVYALGGLNIQDFETAKRNGAYGLSAKRALWGLKEQLCC